MTEPTLDIEVLHCGCQVVTEDRVITTVWCRDHRAPIIARWIDPETRDARMPDPWESLGQWAQRTAKDEIDLLDAGIDAPWETPADLAALSGQEG